MAKTLHETLSQHGLVALDPGPRLEREARDRHGSGWQGNLRRVPKGARDIVDADGNRLLTGRAGEVWRWLRNTGRIR